KYKYLLVFYTPEFEILLLPGDNFLPTFLLLLSTIDFQIAHISVTNFTQNEKHIQTLSRTRIQYFALI
ncbi:MAG: hypothetical protein PVF14_11120, partial [Desulfobacterales bacterium]